MLKPRVQTFNDGVVTIYAVRNAAPPGKAPVQGLVQKTVLRYRERTVGLTRYFTAKQDNVRVDAVLRVPFHPAVCAQDVAVPADGRQYEIKLVQRPENILPPVMDLTLTRLESPYEIRDA